MIKRVIIGGSAGLLLMGFLFGQDAVSYVRTSAGWVKQSVTDSVPVEFQIERARGMINDLEPEVRRNKHLIVKEEVALEQLAERVAKLEGKQSKEKNNLVRMQAEVQKGDQYIYFAGTQYTRDQVTRDMTNRFDRFKTNDETLFNLRRVLNARQNSLTAARAELEQMLAARGQLLAEVAKLEARQTMVEVAQSSSEFNLDKSSLARANQLVQDIETRLDVTERLLSEELVFAEEIPLDGEESDDVLQQIADYFGQNDDLGVAAVAAEVSAESKF